MDGAAMRTCDSSKAGCSRLQMRVWTFFGTRHMQASNMCAAAQVEMERCTHCHC